MYFITCAKSHVHKKTSNSLSLNDNSISRLVSFNLSYFDYNRNNNNSNRDLKKTPNHVHRFNHTHNTIEQIIASIDTIPYSNQVISHEFPLQKRTTLSLEGHLRHFNSLNNSYVSIGIEKKSKLNFMFESIFHPTNTKFDYTLFVQNKKRMFSFVCSVHASVLNKCQYLCIVGTSTTIR